MAIRYQLAAVAIITGLLMPAASFAQSGGAGGGAASGGSLGSSAGSPGTNSAGTAAPGGSATTGSAATGTGDPMVDKQDKQVDKKIKSICKGC